MAAFPVWSISNHATHLGLDFWIIPALGVFVATARPRRLGRTSARRHPPSGRRRRPGSPPPKPDRRRKIHRALALANPTLDILAFTPLPTLAPPQAADEFTDRIRAGGYTLAQAGAIPGNSGSFYTAWIYTRFEFGEPVGSDTFVVGFYLRRGGIDQFIGSVSPSPYSEHIPIYPSYYRLANWDNPQASMLGLSHVDTPDGPLRQLLGLQGYAADINRNGRPEFVFGAEYCPIACSSTTLGYDYFEIGENDQILDLASGLPGRIRFVPIQVDPPVFDASNSYWIGDSAAVFLPHFVSWDGAAFVETEQGVEAELLKRIQVHTERLKLTFGERFGRDQDQADAINILLLYERIGKRQEGLEAFLNLTDPQNWPRLNQRSLCWLQTARATAQQELKEGAPFSVFLSMSSGISLYPSPGPAVLAAPLAAAGYDVSACR